MLKHSRVNRFKVGIDYGEQLKLMITDDGAGMEPTSKTGEHYGLGNMARRAGDINASYDLRTAVGEGVAIAVEL